MKIAKPIFSAVLLSLTGAIFLALPTPSFAQIVLIGPAVNDGSFETPVTSTFVYTPSGTPWTFTGSSGISTNSNNGTTYGVNGGAENGNQYAFLQVNGSGSTATISQTFNLSSAASVAVSFYIGGRTSGGSYGGSTIFSASIDGNAFDLGTTSSNEVFTAQNFAASSLGAGSHTLTFSTFELGNATGDNTAVLDNVSVTTPNVAVSPEPGSATLLFGSLMATPVLGLAVRSRRNRR